MKLLRYGPIGTEITCVLDERGHIRDISKYCPDLSGNAVSLVSLEVLRNIDPNSLPQLPDGARIGSCLRDAPNIFAIGLNYTKHAAEAGRDVPAEPVVFNKATSAISGPHDPIIIPTGARHVDWEVELGLAIGADCYQVSTADALSFVSGYFTANDVSERTHQLHRAGQWVKGKSAPSFAPIGPYFMTADEIDDPNNLSLKTIVNGKTMQSSNTSDMVFSIAEIIANLSQYCRLRTGDIILTGTPEGVGSGQKPKPRFLRAGDVIEVAIERLGVQKMDVI